MEVLSNLLSGGRPGITASLRNKYTRYAEETASSGKEPMAWEEWVKTQGYELGKDLLVQRPKQQQQQRKE